MRCKSCDCYIESEIKDPKTGDFSDLCANCFRVSEYVRENVYYGETEYAQSEVYPGLTKKSTIND